MDNPPVVTDFRKRLPLIIGLLLALVPVIHLIIYLRGYLVDLPWWDEYDTSVFIAEKTITGTLTLPDLLLQQNEHIILFTNLITVISTWLFRWYVPLGSWISVILAVINLLLLLDIFRRDCPQMLPVAAPVFSALIFSFRQIANWQSAFQSQWFFVLMWFFLALWVLRARPVGWRPVISAALFSVLATYSFTLGLLQWILLPGVMLLIGYRNWRHYAFWAAAAAANLALYLVLHVPNPGRDYTFDLLSLVNYSLINLGGPLTWIGATIAVACALVVLSILVANLVFLWRRVPPPSLSTWLALVTYAGAAAFANALGRAFMVENDYALQPLLGRYVTVSSLLWIAATAFALMSLSAIAQNAARWYLALLRRANAVFLIGMLGALLLATVLFYEFTVTAVLVTPQQAECVRAYPRTRDDACLEGLHARIDVVRRGVLIMARNRLSVFARQP